MHEASIALSIIDIAGEQCRLAGCAKVESISVNVGRASGVMPGALMTAFDIVKADTVASGARLLINEIPLGGSCMDCGRDFTTQDPFIVACPTCESGNFRMDKGRELDIIEIEAE